MNGFQCLEKISRPRRGRFQTLENAERNFPNIGKSRAGFSLLEVLVALAVFGIAAGGILVALGHHIKNVSYIQDHARAVRIASREMDSLRRIQTLEEETDGSEDRFSWVTQVSTDGMDDWPGLDEADGAPVLLTVTVEWRDHEEGPVTGRVRLEGFDVFGAED